MSDELLAMAAELADRQGSVSLLELMMMREALASRGLDRGDGETFTVD